jgi:hypothetical protein
VIGIPTRHPTEVCLAAPGNNADGGCFRTGRRVPWSRHWDPSNLREDVGYSCFCSAQNLVVQEQSESSQYFSQTIYQVSRLVYVGQARAQLRFLSLLRTADSLRDCPLRDLRNVPSLASNAGYIRAKLPYVHVCLGMSINSIIIVGDSWTARGAVAVTLSLPHTQTYRQNVTLLNAMYSRL